MRSLRFHMGDLIGVTTIVLTMLILPASGQRQVHAQGGAATDSTAHHQGAAHRMTSDMMRMHHASGMHHASLMDRTDRMIRVTGRGEIKVEPDMVTVQIAIETDAENSETARRRNAEASASAMNAIRALGIAETDVQMRNLSLQPRRVYNPDTRTYEQEGFRAQRSVQVTVLDLDMLPQLIADVVDRGANRIHSVTYGLDDRTEIEREALRLAVVDARSKAQVMASAADAAVGMAVTIEERAVNVPSPVVRSFEAMTSKDAQVQGTPEAFAGGTISVQADVSVAFNLK